MFWFIIGQLLLSLYKVYGMKSLNVNYMSRLDHLRFFAAILVIFFHLRGDIALDRGQWAVENFEFLTKISRFISKWLINGSTGVSLFLVLSGFLFCVISGFGNKKIKYTGFIYNRIIRIFPLMVFLCFIIMTVNRQNSTPMDVFRILTLQLNTGHSYTGWGHEFFPSGPIWTIAVEFQFYLLFPLLALFLGKYGVRYLLSLVVLMIGTRFMIFQLNNADIYYNIYHSIIGRLDQLIIGMIFASLWNKGYFNFLKLKRYAFLGILLPIILLTSLFHNRTDSWYVYLSFTFEAILWGILIVSYLNLSFNINHYVDKTLSKLGEISFSLYLLHLPIAIVVDKMFSLPVPQTLNVSLFLTSFKIMFIIAISFFTFHTIEKPFMALRVKYTSSQQNE